LDPYHILGVDRDADQKVIKKAYRFLAKTYHPDTSEMDDSESKFQEILHAYLILSDPAKKVIYDNGFELPTVAIPARDKYPPPHAFTRGTRYVHIMHEGPQRYGYVDYSLHVRSAYLFGIVCLLFAFTFIADQVFLNEFSALEVSRVKSKILETRNAADVGLLIVFAGDHQFDKRQVELNEIKIGEIISLRKSRIYGYKSFKREKSTSYVYGNKPVFFINFLSVIIMIFALLAIFIKNNPTLKFNSALVSTFFSAVLLALVLIT
jgi:DnaJ domain